MTAFGVWLLAYLGPVVGYALFASVADAAAGNSLRRLRIAGVGIALLATVVALVASFTPELLDVTWLEALPLGAEPTLIELGRLDTFSRALVVLPPALWLLTVAVTPRGQLDQRTLRRLSVATAITCVTFLSTHPVMLALGWLGSVAVYVGAHRGTGRVFWVICGYLGLSSVLLVAGVAVCLFNSASPLGVALIAAAALMRKGVFPFHAWVPEVFENGRLGPSILFSAPQVGSYVCALLVVPYGDEALLRVVASLGLGTAVYAAALAVVQVDPRRAAGYLFVAQSALVVAGLDCTSPEALSGALVLWLSSAIAFAALARVILVVEARRGRLSLARLNGGFEQTPMLAGAFLVTGLACTGFPGTLGFIGEELLVAGAIAGFPYLGYCVVVCSAFTGLAVMRMYFSLFCGAGAPVQASARLQLRPREVFGFGVAVVFLVAAGLFPRSIVNSRTAASHDLLSQRALVQAQR